jgi:hypothetical protein
MPVEHALPAEADAEEKNCSLRKIEIFETRYDISNLF